MTKILTHLKPINIKNYLFLIRRTMSFKYPEIRRDETVKDNYHGVEIIDPYRWLEAPDSEETKKFVNDQNLLTKPYIESLPYRNELKEDLTNIFNFPKAYEPFRQGDNYFQFKNSGLQNQNVMFTQKSVESLKSDPKLFYDFNTLSKDGTVSLQGMKFSEDGSVMAYGLSSAGSDWIEIRFRNVETGADHKEILKKVKFSSMSWLHNNKGFFYCAYLDQEGITDGSETNANKNQKIYFHLLGTQQSEDIAVVSFDDPFMRLTAIVSFCGKYLVVTSRKGVRNNCVYYYKLNPEDHIKEALNVKPLISVMEAEYQYITNNGSKFIFRTNRKAPNYRMIVIDLENPDETQWKTLVPDHSKDVLEVCHPIRNNLMVLIYLRDVKNTIHLHDLDTGKKIKDFPLEIGSITTTTGKRMHNELFFGFTSFLKPYTIYRIDFTQPEHRLEVIHETKVGNFDAAIFESKQVFYESKDGTSVPMFIVHRKDLAQDGSRPCLLYAYGGFGINITPSFSISRLLLIKNFNGVFALANIRGGGEYGEKWHEAGMFERKQNCMDDFEYAARYLISKKYTNPSRLVIQGGSNGGLLVGAAINQAPHLYGAAICSVGVLDMLRFHLFTIGYAWKQEYGGSDNPEQFRYLIKYSPLHNIKIPENRVQYPAVLLTTADHDDRVVPLHSFKFISELQHKLGNLEQQVNPLMIRIDVKAGHGAGKPTSKIIDEIVDYFCFIGKSLDLEYKKT